MSKKKAKPSKIKLPDDVSFIPSDDAAAQAVQTLYSMALDIHFVGPARNGEVHTRRASEAMTLLRDWMTQHMVEK